MAFDVDSAGVYNGSYFGFEFSIEDSALVLLSVPWDATVSYSEGTSKGPEAMIQASMQVEIHDEDFPQMWEKGIFTLPSEVKVQEINIEAREAAKRVIAHIEKGGSELDQEVLSDVNFVNECSRWVNTYVYKTSRKALEENKVVGLVGGDHSSPLGLIAALSERSGDFGILHLDAHMDLRDGYEGFTYSHASIMRRAIEHKQVSKVVQVGVRDFSGKEASFSSKAERVESFTSSALFASRAEGKSWAEISDEIISQLPQEVYVSFDVDCLDPSYCPSTGTPVPGGLSYNEALYLLVALARSGRRIIGFDLCEVAPAEEGEWDANVGARLLYKLCNLTLSTQDEK